MSLTEEKVRFLNSQPGNENEKDGVECSDCLNRGYFFVLDSVAYSKRDCKCMTKRRSIARMRHSGLGNLLDECTLEAWEEKYPWQSQIKRIACDYAEKASGWLYLGGRPGTGKTHICTAVCRLLIDAGHELRYVVWPKFLKKAQALRFDDYERENLIHPLETVKVLYLDDLFKVEDGERPKPSDVDLAFEILNARYNNRELLTIISSEFTLENLISLDEGLGSRIREKSKEHCADLSSGENWRLA